jgi:hypothetical protein
MPPFRLPFRPLMPQQNPGTAQPSASHPTLSQVSSLPSILTASLHSFDTDSFTAYTPSLSEPDTAEAFIPLDLAVDEPLWAHGFARRPRSASTADRLAKAEWTRLQTSETLPITLEFSKTRTTMTMHLWRAVRHVFSASEAMWEELQDRLRLSPVDCVWMGWKLHQVGADTPEEVDSANRRQFEALLERYERQVCSPQSSMGL